LRVFGVPRASLRQMAEPSIGSRIISLEILQFRETFGIAQTVKRVRELEIEMAQLAIDQILPEQVQFENTRHAGSGLQLKYYTSIFEGMQISRRVLKQLPINEEQSKSILAVKNKLPDAALGLTIAMDALTANGIPVSGKLVTAIWRETSQPWEIKSSKTFNAALECKHIVDQLLLGDDIDRADFLNRAFELVTRGHFSRDAVLRLLPSAESRARQTEDYPAKVPEEISTEIDSDPKPTYKEALLLSLREALIGAFPEIERPQKLAKTMYWLIQKDAITFSQFLERISAKEDPSEIIESLLNTVDSSSDESRCAISEFTAPELNMTKTEQDLYSPEVVLDILRYRNEHDEEPFTNWLSNLSIEYRAKIEDRLVRFSLGNFGDHEYLRAGLFEARFHFSSGLRVYFTTSKDGIVVITGGDKATQDNDIEVACEIAEKVRATHGKGAFRPK
jgi:putative addiction module killer protein